VPALPVIPTFVDGVLSSTTDNQLAAAVAFLFTPPRARLVQTVAQSLTTSVWAAATFDAEVFDLFPAGYGATGGHSTSSNTSRYTCEFPGTYLLSGNGSFANNATGIRATRWAVNGTAVNATASGTTALTGNPTSVGAAGFSVVLAVGDYVELQLFQSSGGALNTSVSGADESSMSVLFVGA